MENTYICKGKQLADYLISHGSKLIKSENFIYYFEKDPTINENIEQWKKITKMLMF